VVRLMTGSQFQPHRTSGHQDIRTSGHQDIRTTGENLDPDAASVFEWRPLKAL
jgi:hypothetical protein